MFEREIKLIGIDNLNKIGSKKILVVGVGGVGSYTVESLVRAGIKNITVIDSDKVDITNKNRQLIALDSTIGLNKTDVISNRIKDINNACTINKECVFLDKDNTKDYILKYNPDYVIDCCDTITVKKEIIKTCLEHNIKFISSMGTGNRIDNTKFKIEDIRKTSYDPLAKIIRKWVKDNKIKGKIPVLINYSEIIKIKERTVASISYVPSTGGLILSGYIINDILKGE